VIISHGHYDHGGGLKAFLEVNSIAKIYIHKNAFEEYYSKRSNNEIVYIGLDKSLKEHQRIVFTEDYLYIDEELALFSNCKGKRLLSSANNHLYMKENEKLVQDQFNHEQNLIITEDDKKVLVAGCAHKGIVNILQHCSDIKDSAIDHVIGGFHLMSKLQTTRIS
jgi:7,8-dihydropterin-6-yl-methyl-4-(beta-D-ribofuranosyl)aminobenzene 5'-phosphate synthase